MVSFQLYASSTLALCLVQNRSFVKIFSVSKCSRLWTSCQEDMVSHPAVPLLAV